MFLLRRDSSGPAPGQPYLDPEPYRTVPLYNRRSALLALTITFLVFSWVCSLLRLYARLFILRPLGWDDLFILLTMISTTAGSVVLCILPGLGMGTSIYTMTVPEIQDILRVMYIGNASYPLSATFIRIALLFQYLRIFEPGLRCRRLCKCMIVITAMWGLVFAILSWVPCYPVAAYWDFSIQGARCWGFGSHDLLEFMQVFVAQAITTAILDFIVFIIPAQLYFRPDADRKTRLSLVALFILGLTVNLCSLWRMAYVMKLYMAGTGSFDPTWYSPTAAGLACLEVHLATVCAALPVFWPVLKTTWNKIFVTFEVSVTEEYGPFPLKADEVELQSASSDRNLAADPPQKPESWEPFVGDETTGLGENETVVETPAGGNRPRTVAEILRRLKG